MSYYRATHNWASKYLDLILISGSRFTTANTDFNLDDIDVSKHRVAVVMGSKEAEKKKKKKIQSGAVGYNFY